ncbi:hypothetical protein [Bradyrhizobium sp. Tv2a-2]|uniref:hypothetical protein n=1 Tax=Bradyrhizobium sp. Tv2a-2 TaxID=113395 RepID=UPI00055C3D64|nr:hypothetical protein [Bradyrhizobium sp. Tv2a-2]
MMADGKGPLAAECNQYPSTPKRNKLLLSITQLLRYAQAEIAELDLEISGILLEATIADIARELDRCAADEVY